MRRVFWLGVGATIGVLVVRKATKTAESLTPKGMSTSLSRLGEAVRDFADDVRAAMNEHEQDLLTALGVDADGTTDTSTAGSPTTSSPIADARGPS